MYDVRKSKNQYFKVIKKFITASQKSQNNNNINNKHNSLLPEIFSIFECLLTQDSRLSTFLILPDHIEDYLKIQKQRVLRNYFSLKMISKIVPHYIFQKDIQIFETWKTTKDMKFRHELYCAFLFIYEINIKHCTKNHISQVLEYHRKLKKSHVKCHLSIFRQLFY